MRHRTFIFLLIAVLLLGAGCSGTMNKEETPITVTVWHVYGGQADSPLNDLIDRFNQTVGKEQRINVQVTSVSTTNTIHELVLAAANGEPGASELPDLFISYPKTVMALPDDSILVDYRDYFSEEELSAFLPAFVEEGMVDNRLLILPVAKSTEIMFINKTIFDRFSQATGVTLEDLDTWEGLFRAAEIYAAWTDGQTPDVLGDAKSMFVHDYYFNYFQVGAESLGEDFFRGDELAFGPAFQTAWEPLAQAALQGGVWLEGGYATASLRTGDSIVSVASSASILYYSDVVTYPDNTSEDTIEHLRTICEAEEIARSKDRVHDLLGQRISLLLRALRESQKPDETLLLDFANSLPTALREDRKPSPVRRLEMLQETFRGMEVDVEIQGALPEDEAVADTFAEIAVECVTNAVRHGYATRIQFNFFQNSCWRMTVTDNGIPPAKPIREGGGIGGMRRRIAQLGGVMELYTVPRFRIELSVPKEAEQT